MQPLFWVIPNASVLRNGQENSSQLPKTLRKSLQITRHAFSLASDQVSRQKFCESRDISKNSCAPRGVMDHDGIRNFEVVRFIRNTNI